MIKKIKIFLASSIEEEGIKTNRVEIGDFFNELNNIYIDSNIFFKLIKCEDYDSSIARERKQQQYDEEIRDSELVFFLFFKKVGDYTKHEFEVALESFKDVKKPKIVTYFREVESGEEINEEVRAFMNMLDQELGHYYDSYGTIDALKLGMLMQIKLMKLDASVVDIQNGEVCLNGKAIAKTDNIPIFAGNEDLQALKARVAELDREYYAIREKSRENPDDTELDECCHELFEERKKAREKLRELEKRVLGLAERMTEDTASDRLTYRQREGYRLIQKGDYDGALEVLSYEEIWEDIRHNEKLADCINDSFQDNVNELLQRIEALKAKDITDGVAAEIVRIYEDAKTLADKHGLDKAFLYDYASFIRDQKDFTKAIEIAKLLEYYWSHPNEKIDEDKWARLYNLLGVLYSETKSYKEAEENLKKALEIYERLVEQNQTAYEPDLAGSYNNLGALYATIKSYKEAEENYKKALEIYKRLVKQNRSAYEPDLAGSYNNLGNLYRAIGSNKEAEENHKRALEIRERLVEQNQSAYEPDLAGSYNNLGALYATIKSYKEAEENYKKALEIYKRLVKQNQTAYEPDLAMSYNNLGALYRAIGSYKEAEENYKKALEIRERLVKQNQTTYEPDLAMSYNNLGVLYRDTGSYKEAEENYKKALEIRGRLVEQNQTAYEPDLAKSYHNLGVLYNNTGSYKEAEENHKKALEIRERLVKQNREAYELSLAMSYDSLGALCFYTGRYEEFKENLEKAAEIYERLSKKYPEVYAEKLQSIKEILEILANSTT